MTTWLTTSSRTQFRVIDGLKAFAGRTRRGLLTGDRPQARRRDGRGTHSPAGADHAARPGRAYQPGNSTQLFTGPRPAGWHLRTAQSAEPPGLRSFGHAYPGMPEQVQGVRADLGAILDGCPVADETILVASELAANAVTHSSSRQEGGQFTVRAAACPGDYIWVEVEDQGGIWAGHHPRDGRPHGLDIVQAVAGDGSWGIDGDATLGRVAWARLDWPGR